MSIPIYMMGTAGVSRDGDPLMAPCINCLIINPLTQKRVACWAMLDSGAFPNGISSSVAAALGLDEIGTDTLHAALSVSESNIYEARVAIEGMSGELTHRFHSIEQQANGHPYEVILGRQFLTAFDFGFDYARQAWHLSAPTPSP